MDVYPTPADLQIVLEPRCEKMRMTKGSVLFQRGEKATGLFIVFSGRVSLDLGVDTALARSYGSGALLGLPATLTKGNFSMTATVTEDAEIGFWGADAMDLLLRKHPHLCHQLLAILREGMARYQQVVESMRDKERTPLYWTSVA